MKFMVVTYGTEGDTRPLAALCRRLMDTGHDATLLADAATLASAHELGVPTRALAGDIKGVLNPEIAISHVVGGGSRVTNTLGALARIANVNAEAWMREMLAAGSDCDAMIVAGLAAFVGLSVAEHLRVTAIGAGLIPITPTVEFPSPFLPPARVPQFLNRVSHKFVNEMLWRAFRKATNAARSNVCGLAPRKTLWKDHPMLYGVSLSLLPRPRDWPGNARVCGQWTTTSPDCSPSRELLQFLSAGEAPVYVGFGSMGGFDAHRLMKEVVAALAGRRVLFNPGWSGMDVSLLPANFFVIGDTPHG